MRVIINSDDFGWSENVTRATIEAVRGGFCSSTTLLANGVFFSEASEMILKMKLDCSVGIHFNLTEGLPLTNRMRCCLRFCDQDGHFRRNNVFLKWLSSEERNLVADEFRAQILKLRKAGVSISHADGHHHVHVCPAVYPMLSSVLKESGITKVRLSRKIFPRLFGIRATPLRIVNYLLKKNFTTANSFCGGMESYNKYYEWFVRNDSCEIMIHAGRDGSGNLFDWVATSQLLRPNANDRLISYNEL